mgnify:CR=1 FL=1
MIGRPAGGGHVVRRRARRGGAVAAFRRGVLLAALALGAVGGPIGLAAAQPPERDGERDRVREALPGARPRVDRMAALVRERLGLDEAQGARLREVTGRFAGERERLLRDERAARRALRAELARGDAADGRAVERQLELLLTKQERRVELVRAEQRELARFLTPVQRAEFLALQERAFRAAQQQRARREFRHDGIPPGADRGMPPGPRRELPGRPPR